MRLMRAILCLAFVCLMAALPAAAAPVGAPADRRSLALATAAAPSGIVSHVQIALDLSPDEAAQRLYYLGLMSGAGVRGGRIDFQLGRNLTRLECIVMTARLLGVETEILTENGAHPFCDVPSWGSPYVAYFWRAGLLSTITGEYFQPDAHVSTNTFLRFMFYALGYASDGSDYDLIKAAVFGAQAGICQSPKSALTRGDAALILLNTLNASVADSDAMLSETYVENRYLNYQDVQFLLWCEVPAQTEAYIRLRGYTTEKILPDGKYTIVLKDSERCLNVQVDGANNDYEGVGVSVWKRTDDVSQKFRVARTETGTYRLYSCASNGGYNRVLGIGNYGTAGLYGAVSRYAGEYYIRYADENDGSWLLIPVSDSSKVLATTDAMNNAPVTLGTAGDAALKYAWKFELDPAVSESGYELALYPSETLCVTQGAYDTFSHQKQNALDITTPNRMVYAPFTGKIVRIDRGYSHFNTVWLESCDKVVYADGTVDYMTVVFMHDDNVADLTVGQIVGQGAYFYDAGVAGGATGAHVHIACIRGKYKNTMSLTGSGDVNVENALFLPADVTVQLSYGLDWVYTNND